MFKQITGMLGLPNILCLPLKIWLIIWLSSVVISNITAQNIVITPTPKKTEYPVGGGYALFKKGRDLRLAFVQDLEGKSLHAAEIVNEAFKERYNIATSLERDPRDAQIQLVLIDEARAIKDLKIPPQKLKEAYHLSITQNRIRIEGVTPQGVFYGAITLAQIIEQTKDSTLKAIQITDYPDFDIRGISDDISRGQVSNQKNFKKLIQKIARYKLNTLMLYIEDMIQLDKYSEIGKNRGALTKKEVREIIEYAQKNYVEIIPIFQTFAHQENILSLDQFQSLAEFPGSTSFCTSCNLTYSFLDNVLKEICTLFPAEYIHLGGDESFDAGLGFSLGEMNKIGQAELILQHYLKVYNIAKKYGKKVNIYGDMLLKYPQILSKLPKDIQIVDWQYQPDSEYSSNITFQQVGLPYLVSPTVHNSETVFPFHISAISNIQNLATYSYKYGARGVITANWGNMGGETLKEQLYFLYRWTGQCAWSTENVELASFTKNYFMQFFKNNASLGEEIYQRMSATSFNITWKDFWRHPMLDFLPFPSWHPQIDMVAKLTSMEWAIPLIQKDLDSLKKTATKNQDQTEVLQLSLDIHKYYVKKVRTQLKLKELAALSPEDRQKKAEEINNLIDENVVAIQTLKAEYQKIWQKYYKPEGLQFILQKFDRLVAYFGDSKDDILFGKSGDPRIASKWIYTCPKPDSCSNKAIFHKEFTFKEIPQQAVIQLIADTYAELIVNGQYVGRVFVRNISSIHLENEVIKWFDIKDYIKEGVNTVDIKVTNYNEGLRRHTGNPQIYTAAGVNVSGFIRGDQEEVFLNSDATWVSKKKDADKEWQKVFSHPYRYDIIAPNFQAERHSWIER